MASKFYWPHTKARIETSLKGNHFAILHRFLYLQGKVGAKAPPAPPGSGVPVRKCRRVQLSLILLCKGACDDGKAYQTRVVS